MIQALVLGLMGAAIWRIRAPASAFLRGFASLLHNPERGRAGLAARLTFTDFVGGEYDGRPVTLVLRPKRNRHQLGYLVLGLATATTFHWSGSRPTAGTDVSTPRMREALDVLIGRHGLALALDDGWLKATWMPVGFFIFPGRFDAEKWRDVLAHMQMLASELEGTQRAAAGLSPAAARPLG